MATNGIVKEPNLAAVIGASHDARTQALTLLDQVAATGNVDNAPAEAQLEISKQQKLLITHLAQVRGLHRAAHFSSRKTKQETAEARHEVDRLRLQLQNLYYEQRHLQGEISACESYECVLALLLRGLPHATFRPARAPMIANLTSTQPYLSAVALDSR